MNTGTRALSVDAIDLIREQEQGLFRWVRRLSRLELGASALFLAVDMRTRIDNESFESLSEGTSLVVFLTSVLLAVSWTASGLFFVRWIYRCIDSEGRLGERGYANRPRDIVWAYIIPFLNLVRPYEIIKRLAATSDPGDLPVAPAKETVANDYRESPRVEPRDAEAWRRSFPLGIWWGLWVVDSIVSRVYSKLPDAPVPAERLDWVVMLTFASGVLGLVKTGFFLRVIDSLQARRDERFERLRAIALERSIDRRMGV